MISPARSFAASMTAPVASAIAARSLIAPVACALSAFVEGVLRPRSDAASVAAAATSCVASGVHARGLEDGCGLHRRRLRDRQPQPRLREHVALLRHRPARDRGAVRARSHGSANRGLGLRERDPALRALGAGRAGGEL